MNYEQAMEKINSLLVFGVKPGLDRMRKLLDLMGNPQDKLKYVHVAGTNGKGSVCNMTAAVLTAQGFRTGLFTSPHITGFGERMQIDFTQISPQEITRKVEKLFPLADQLREQGVVITEFEFVTAMAFDWFAENKCDFVVLETGLGGRFDATNVIKTPLCSVITSVSLDHTAVLGDTLEKIASEKCGIIKEGGSTVYNMQEECVNSQIERYAQLKDNVVFVPKAVSVISSDICGSTVEYDGRRVFLPLLGEHQTKNLALVMCTVDVLRGKGVNISPEAEKNGIACVKMPARFELLSSDPMIILDGAHNPGGLQALSRAIDRYLSDKTIICVMGMLRDKDSKTALGFLEGRLHKVITTQINGNPRTLTAQELKAVAQAYFTDITAEENVGKAVDKAIHTAQAAENGVVLVCGSLYLASEVREILSDRG